MITSFERCCTTYSLYGLYSGRGGLTSRRNFVYDIEGTYLGGELYFRAGDFTSKGWGLHSGILGYDGKEENGTSGNMDVLVTRHKLV